MKHLEYYVICGALLFSVGLSYAFYKKLIAEERQILEEATYNLVNTWELPELLNEVSGIAWVNDSTIACIQDEEGAIYHFNWYGCIQYHFSSYCHVRSCRVYFIVFGHIRASLRKYYHYAFTINRTYFCVYVSAVNDINYHHVRMWLIY